VEEIRTAIDAELQVGSPATEIEGFFERHNIDYGWDNIEKLYNGVIRDIRPYEGITIRIFVDKDRCFLRADVEYAYTAP
jgi:hypothetical protein